MLSAKLTPPMKQALGNILHGLREDKFFLILLAGLLLLSALAPRRIPDYASLVDWPTLAALAGLLLLTKGLELSGVLHRLGHALVGWMATERAAALCLVGAAALLSTVLTNDVALFVVVPLTLSVCRLANMPATKLIIFEALAVNAGSALTPIGNPQNLFLWQLAKVSFGEFVWHMLPLVVLLMLALLALTAAAFGGRPIEVRDDARPVELDRTLLGVSLLLYVPFLIATDMNQTKIAAAVIVLVFLALRRKVLEQLDWGLLLVFMLMFIDLRLLAGLDVVRHAMQGLGLDQPAHLYLASVGASQIVSNVPATIALVEYSKDWRVIAYGVNVGGFGFMVGSLANLIALRLSGDPKAWRRFHVYAVPALLVAAALGHAVLFLSGYTRIH
jgi:di/tricarboxylate transporter